MNKRNISNYQLLKKIALVHVYVYPVWLAVYLILHENNAYFGLIPLPVSLTTFFYYFLFVGVTSFCLKYFLKSKTKVFLFTTLLMFFLIFFGSMQDYIKELPVTGFFKKYSFLLSFIIVVIIAVFIYLKRSKKEFQHLGKYIQLTIAILVIWELGYLAFNVFSGKINENILFEKSQKKLLTPAITTANTPNIYFIVFDSFTSSSCLQEEFGYNNAELDSFLSKSGFYIVTKSKSNYPVTPYSIASTLNFSYLSDTLNNQLLTAKDILQGQATVAQSRLIPYLQAKGYKIINHSVFDFKDYPAPNRVFFNEMPTKVLIQQTLFGRVNKDILWNFNRWKFSNDSVNTERSIFLKEYVTDKMKGLKNAVAEKQPMPKFVYCHIMLPHEPYFFNKDGTLKSDSVTKHSHSLKMDYLNQLIYTRQLVKESIKVIMDKDTLNKIIVLEGDHGFRDFGVPGKTNRYFDNLNAIYFYDKNYSALHDSITPVNTFRVILNQYFHEQLKYLPDTSIYIHDPGNDVGQIRKN